MSDDKRITDLEVRMAFLEKLQEDQNQVIYDQQKTLDALGKKLGQLRGRQDSNKGEVSGDQPPPHY